MAKLLIDDFSHGRVGVSWEENKYDSWSISKLDVEHLRKYSGVGDQRISGRTGPTLVPAEFGTQSTRPDLEKVIEAFGQKDEKGAYWLKTRSRYCLEIRE